MKYEIFKQGRFTHVDGNDLVKTTKNVHSFATCNKLRDCLVKSQGGYYKLGLDGILTFAAPALNTLTFEELNKILKD